jgi:putative transposase
MSVFGYILPGAWRLSRLTDLDKVALYRLAIVEFYLRNDKRGRLTAKTFRVSTATVYRWVSRYKKWNLATLRSRSTRPHQTRIPTTDWQTVERVVEIRKANLTWSKYKIGYQIRKEGFVVSDSTVGRILKRKDLIPVKLGRKKRKRVSLTRPRADKKLWNQAPGYLIQVDTAYLNPKGRRYCFQYTAIDTYTRLSFARVYPTRGSKNGKLFLKEVKRYFPFPIKAVQSDNGSEFLGDFHHQLEKEDKIHYFSYPATPKMNSRVERMIRTTRDELWNQGYLLGDLDDLNESLEEYLITYNTKRPHQALGYQTPMDYYLSIKKEASRFRNC